VLFYTVWVKFGPGLAVGPMRLLIVVNYRARGSETRRTQCACVVDCVRSVQNQRCLDSDCDPQRLCSLSDLVGGLRTDGPEHRTRRISELTADANFCSWFTNVRNVRVYS